MSKPRWSLGPWKLEIIEKGSGGPLARILAADGTATAWIYDITHPENRSNAELIACAPELLHALKAARRQLNANGATAEELDAYDAVIGKAEGWI